MTRAWRTVAVLVTIGAAQASAVIVYRWVERAREARTMAPSFQYERLVPHPAPDLTLSAPDGGRRQLSSYRGRPLLLHFWATWCPPCKAELPALLALGHELDQQGGARVLALATDSDWDSVRAFFDGGAPPEVVRDESGLASSKFAVSTLPDTYLIAADGQMLLRFGGPRDWSTNAARELLREADRSDRSP